ncbi:CPBP family intramembrane metalloprotease [Gordonia sp. PDNC005]|uniref:CPBP family intramembrane glutamic endopeptidase n=1 Tax=Gordonia sp. PDNC005 TaxID=2811424 RepID=UPI001962BB45|nr:CPBP family intramembrane glutamic endopeptidase [Gordonia sp. PDNC005]QRY62465.1 CPBP family intramembrane metalloprotease [Gordonia sp. PDNC005]
MRVEDPRQRRAIVVELVIVGILTFGFSALSAILSLIESQLGAGISETTVALNPAESSSVVIDVIQQLMRAARLLAIGALGAYLLWRTGIHLKEVGLGRPSRRDLAPGAGLAAAIGIPGLVLVAAASALGLNGHLIPAPDGSPWWRMLLLCLIAAGNAVAEEVVVVGYFMTRLRQLGVGEGVTLVSSAVLRGGYHLYQGVGAGVGNVVMGLVFGRWYQKTNRLWPLIIAHAFIDVIAFVGYALLADHLGWLGL